MCNKQPTGHWSIEVHFDATIVDPVQRFSQAGFYRNDPKHVHTGKCGVVLGAGNKGKPVSPETHFGLCGGGYTHGPLVAATCKGSAFTRQWGGMEWDGPRRQYSTGFGTGVLSICDTLHLLFEKGMVVFLKHHPIRAYGTATAHRSRLTQRIARHVHDSYVCWLDRPCGSSQSSARACESAPAECDPEGIRIVAGITSATSSFSSSRSSGAVLLRR